MSETKPSLLNGAELAYELLKSQGVSVLGNRQGPFAIANHRNDELLIFGADLSNVRYISFEDDDALYPLEVAQKLGASFSVEGTTVTCRIGETVTSGKNYAEAAMRGLLTHGIGAKV